MKIEISKISAIVVMACISLTQLPFVFAVTKQTDWLPISTIIIPLELFVAAAIVVSAFNKTKLLVLLSVSFLLVVSVDLYTSWFNLAEFLNPFAETKYYKIVSVPPETIRFPNRDIAGIFLAVLACFVVIGSRIRKNRITKGSY